MISLRPPANVLLWVLGGALCASVAFSSVQTLRLAQTKTALATEQRDRAADAGRAQQAAGAQIERFRLQEAQRADLQRKAIDEAEFKAAQARADAVLADAARGRLQQRVADLAATARRAAANPSAPGASAPAEDAAGMLADLQRRADETAGIMARVADERGTAGEVCERAYDALTLRMGASGSVQ